MVATTEDMLMITPPTGDCASICRTPSRAQRKTPPAFTRITRSQSCRLVSRIVPTWLMPALLTRISSRPSVAATSSIAALTWDSSATSSCCVRVLPPAARISLATRSVASTLISLRTTWAPCRVKSRAICSPMPDPAPVTKAIFLSKRNTHDSFLSSYVAHHALNYQVVFRLILHFRFFRHGSNELDSSSPTERHSPVMLSTFAPLSVNSAKHLTAQRDRPFASLRACPERSEGVRRFDCSNCQV